MVSQDEIHEMAASKRVEDRREAADILRSSFHLLPDKDRAWQDLHRLTQDQNSLVRWSAAIALSSSFIHLPDKLQSWQDLCRLTQDQDRGVRWGAASALGSTFVLLPDKTLVWQDLHRLAQDQDSGVRWGVADALGSAFAFMPNKIQGWQDIHNLVQDLEEGVRWGAADALGSAFMHLPDKIQGWQDLLRLSQDQIGDVRRAGADALGSAFAFLPDKNQGWKDLYILTEDLNGYARWVAVRALGLAFASLPDKIQGWHVLCRLTQDQNRFVRAEVARSLGSAFVHLPDNMQGWRDLHRLIQDQDRDVRMYAYHSLGRASIYRASESNEKDAIRSELEAAVEFFERSSQEQAYSNPAKFCYPFYRSYLALTFQEASESEVQRYLAEAKGAVGISEDKKELLGAVENLAKALEEAQKLKERSKEQIQSDLKAYQWYCDRAAEYMAAAEEKAPGAVKLLRKCNPIIEDRIVAAIAEIQKTAREICQDTRGSGTKFEAPGAQINQEAKSLSSEDPLKTYKSSTRITSILREFCGLLPKDKRGHACEIVDEIESEQELSGRLSKIELALTYLQPNIRLVAIESATTHRLDQIDKKLDMIIFNLAKKKIGSGNIFANLSIVISELNKIAEIERSSALDPESVLKKLSPPNESQIALGSLIEAKVSELEEVLKTKATKEDTQAILSKLDGQKPSAGFEWLSRIADLIAIFEASKGFF